MKIHVLKDKQGKTIATFERNPKAPAQLEPQVKEGHKVEEAEVPENYASNLHVLYKGPGKKT